MNNRDNENELQRQAAGNQSLKKKKRLSSTRMEEIKWDPDSVFKENSYYIKISFKYKICKYIVAVIAVIFSVVMLTVFSGDITTDNFQYLIKDLDITGLTADGDFTSIIYNGSSDTKFGVFRDELALLKGGTTYLYRSTGALSFSEKNIFYSPRLLVSEKYMLAYDFGNTTNSYSVYNSFAELKSEKLSYPITGAALADSGAYAIITRNDSYKGVLLLYNEDFKLVNEIKKDKYIISAAFSDDGEKIIIASVYDRDGDMITELMTLGVGESEAETTFISENKTVMSVKYLEGGNIAVLYTDSVEFYDGSLRLLSSESLDSLISVRADIGKKLVLTVNNDTLIGNDKTVNIYNENGELIRTAKCSGELLQLRSYEEKVYLLFEDKLLMIDSKDGSEKSVSVSPNSIDLVFTSTGKPIVCYAGNASPISFEASSQTETAD